MTLAEILSDEALRQREFPVTRTKTFLAHAGDCPLPQRVVQALANYARQASEGDQEGVVFPALLQEGRTFEVRRELAAVVKPFLSEALKKGLKLNLKVAPDIPRWLKGECGRLRQVLVNLIGNALKFTDSGRIDVRVHQARCQADRCELQFEIYDTGIGIAPEDHARIFEIFEQGDGSITRRFGGTGLGLAISKRLVAVLDGKIWLESAANEGARFFFTASFTVVGSDGDLADQITQLARRPHGAPPTVLIVDSDSYSLKLLVTMLGRYGFPTLTATDEVSMLQMLRDHKIGLILMEVQLPATSESDLVRMIRTGCLAGCEAGISVVALTTDASEVDLLRLSAAGFSEFVSKPIDIVRLLEVIQQSVH